MSSPDVTGSTEFIEKSRLRRYPRTFKELLSRKMDDYFEYMTQGEHVRALENFALAMGYIKLDKRNRVFWKDRKSKEVDLKKKAEFEALLERFEKLYGTKPADLKCITCGEVICAGDEPAEQKKELAKAHAYKNAGHVNFIEPISLLELRTRDKPDPTKGRISITRTVNFERVWGKHLPKYVYLKVGYYIEDVVEKPDGWQSTFKESQILPDDPLLSKYTTNWVPYAFWEDQWRRAYNEALTLALQLEAYPREYLHKEALQEAKDAKDGVSPMDDDDDQGPSGGDQSTMPAAMPLILVDAPMDGGGNGGGKP